MTNPSPKLITGPLHLDNKGACDWGYQDFIAYGCHGYVVVVDPKTLQTVQTLGEHKSTVTQVRWSREYYHHAFATGSTYSLQLASADLGGVIKVWDVSTGRIRSEFTENSKPVQAMEWYSRHDESHDLLATLHNHETLVLWDGYTGVKLWKKSFFEGLLSFSFDPFNIKTMTILCETPRILVLSDISVTSPPSDNYKTVQFMDPSLTPSKRRSSTASSGGAMLRRSQNSWNKVVSLASNIQYGLRGANAVQSGQRGASSSQSVPDSSGNRQSVSEDEVEYQTSCRQMAFNPAHRDLLLLTFEREIHILDLDVDLTVGVIRLDKAASSFVKVFPCRWLDVLYCLHENGCVTLRVRRGVSVATPTAGILDTPQHQPVSMEMIYDLRCQSDSLRLLHHVQIYSFSCNPLTEKTAAIVLSDSRVILLDVLTHRRKTTKHILDSKESSAPTLSDVIGDAAVLSPSDHVGLKTGSGVILRLVVNGLVGGVTSPVTVTRMMPSAKGNQECCPVLAVGSGVGVVQLVNVDSGQVDTEYKLSMSPIRGIEWVNHNSFLTYSSPDPGPYNRSTRSQILQVFVNSGEVVEIGGSSSKDDKCGPITALLVSPSRTFFVVVLKLKPLEIWNLQTRQMVRELTVANQIAIPTALAWYPYVTWTMVKKPVYSDENPESPVKEEKRVPAEQLFLGSCHETGSLMRISLLDNTVSDISHFSNESLLGLQNPRLEITALCWKEKIMIFGERAGKLYMCNAETKQSTAKKLYDRPGYKVKVIRFAPGKTNLMFYVQYEDDIDVWEIKDHKAEILNSSPPFSSPIVDVEWVGSASPAITTADGCIHVLDLTFKRQSSSIAERALPVPLFSPGLMEAKEAFLTKYRLQCGLQMPRDTAVTVADSQLFSSIGSDTGMLESVSYRGTAHRCTITSRLYGDEFDQDFWRLVEYHIQTGKRDPSTTLLANHVTVEASLSFLTLHQKHVKLSDQAPSVADIFAVASTPVVEVKDLVSLDTTSDPSLTTSPESSWIEDLKPTKPLETCFDIFCDGPCYQRYQTGRLALQNKKRCRYEEKRQCASRYIMLNKMDMAVQVLMETEMENDGFLNDCLKACLVSSLHSSSASLSTIKLAATHLIASGHLLDGVELLCLIDKRLDACKYFMSDGMWQKAIWLAKTSLNDAQCLEVMSKWAEYLWNNSEKNRAVLVMLSQGQYIRVLQMLRELGQYDRAGLFLQACLESGLLENNSDTESFIEAVYLDFAKQLSVVDYAEAVQHYCHLAGTKGENFLQEYRPISPVT